MAAGVDRPFAVAHWCTSLHRNRWQMSRVIPAAGLPSMRPQVRLFRRRAPTASSAVRKLFGRFHFLLAVEREEDRRLSLRGWRPVALHGPRCARMHRGRHPPGTRASRPGTPGRRSGGFSSGVSQIIASGVPFPPVGTGPLTFPVHGSGLRRAEGLPPRAAARRANTPGLPPSTSSTI